MKKKRKKRTHIEEGGGCFLDIHTKGHAFHNHHLIVFLLQFKTASAPPCPAPVWGTRNESGSSSWKPRQKSYIAKAEERDASSSSSGSSTVTQREMSKCQIVLCSPQEIEGFKRLDRQCALFSDYNFVFTSFAKKQQQQQS